MQLIAVEYGHRRLLRAGFFIHVIRLKGPQIDTCLTSLFEFIETVSVAFLRSFAFSRSGKYKYLMSPNSQKVEARAIACVYCRDYRLDRLSKYWGWQIPVGPPFASLLPWYRYSLFDSPLTISLYGLGLK